jgi:hypothetical protein
LGAVNILNVSWEVSPSSPFPPSLKLWRTSRRRDGYEVELSFGLICNFITELQPHLSLGCTRGIFSWKEKRAAKPNLAFVEKNVILKRKEKFL